MDIMTALAAPQSAGGKWVADLVDRLDRANGSQFDAIPAAEALQLADKLWELSQQAEDSEGADRAMQLILSLDGYPNSARAPLKARLDAIRKAQVAEFNRKAAAERAAEDARFIARAEAERQHALVTEGYVAADLLKSVCTHLAIVTEELRGLRADLAGKAKPAKAKPARKARK